MAKIYDAVLKLSSDPFVKGLEKAEAQMEKFSRKYKNISREFKNASKMFTDIGSTLTKSVTLPIAGAVAASIKTGAGFEEQMAKVSSISGATGNDLKELSNLARKMGKETKFSASEAAEGLQYMAMAGWDNKQMAAGLEPILNLAIASGEELGTTSDIVTDAITAFGLKAEDTAHFTDVLATASNSANTNVSILGESFKYVAPIAGAMGYSIEDTSVALGLMANAGIKGSKAGTALSNAFMRLNAPTKSVQSAMDNLNLSMLDSEGNMKPLRSVMDDLRGSMKNLSRDQKILYAEQMFGKEAAGGMLAIIDASAEDYDKLAKSIDNAQGATERMRKIMEDTLGGDWDKLKSSASEAMIQTFEMIKEPLRNALQAVTKLMDKFNSLPEETKGKILKLVGNLALVGPAILGVGKVLGKISGGVEFFGKLSKDVTKAGGVFKLLLSPVGKVTLVLMALATVAFLLINNWSKVKDFFNKLFPNLGENVETFKNKLMEIDQRAIEIFSPVVDSLKSLFDTVSEFVVSVILPLIMKALSTIKNAWEMIWPILSSVIETFVEIVSIRIQAIIGVFDGIITFLTGVFTGNWSQAWEGVKKIFSSVWTGIRDTAVTILDSIIDKINTVTQGIGNIKIPDWVPFAGGKSIGIPEIPKIGKNAMGTSAWTGGLTQINERGGEVVDLPRGTRILPHDKSVQEAYRSGIRSTNNKNNTSVVIPKLADTIVVREDADIDRIADSLYKKLKIAKYNTVGV